MGALTHAWQSSGRKGGSRNGEGTSSIEGAQREKPRGLGYFLDVRAKRPRKSRRRHGPSHSCWDD